MSGSLDDLLRCRRGLAVASILGTLAAWQRRYRHTFMFCGSDALAADFCLRFLAQPVREAERLLGEIKAEEGASAVA